MAEWWEAAPVVQSGNWWSEAPPVDAPKENFPGILEAAGEGFVSGFEDVGQTIDVAKGERPVALKKSRAAEPLEWADAASPIGRLAPKMAYQLTGSMPTLGAGLLGASAGAWGGSMVSPGAGTAVGALGGGAAGAAVGAVAQSLGPYYARELQRTPDDPDAAWDRAVKAASISGVASGAGWAIFKTPGVESAVKNLLVNAFVTQPGINAAEKVGVNAVTGDPLMEGVGSAAAAGTLGTVPIAAAHGFAKAQRGLSEAEPHTRPDPPVPPEPLLKPKPQVETAPETVQPLPAENMARPVAEATAAPRLSMPDQGLIQAGISAHEVGGILGKMQEAISVAEPLRLSRTEAVSQERSRRAGHLRALQEQGLGEEGTPLMYGALKGKFDLPDIDAQFQPIRELFSKENVDAINNYIDSSVALPYDAAKTRFALDKIMKGEVPLQSELNLLRNIFPAEFVETVTKKRKVLQVMGDLPDPEIVKSKDYRESEPGLFPEKVVGDLEDPAIAPRNTPDPSQSDMFAKLPGFKDKALGVAKTIAIDIPTFSKANLASADVSFGGRQGWPAFFSNPKLWFESFGKQYKWMASQKWFDQADKDIQRLPWFGEWVENGGQYNRLDGPFNVREEKFVSDPANKLWWVRGSNRAYTGFGNYYRAHAYNNLKQTILRLGYEDSPKLKQDINRHLNTITGRGKLPDHELVQSALPLINAVLWSPGLYKSRVDLVNPLYYKSLHPAVRKKAVSDAANMALYTSTIMAGLSAAGVDVGYDPRSADFGKAKIGNNRIDLTGGLGQYLRLGYQLLSWPMVKGAEALGYDLPIPVGYVSSTTGRTMTIGEGFKPMSYLDNLTRFLEMKEAPVTSFITDALRGQNVVGQPFSLPSAVLDRLIPLPVQDAFKLYQEGAREGGVSGGIGHVLGYGALVGHGVGVQTYGDTELARGKNAIGQPSIEVRQPQGLSETIVEGTQRLLGGEPTLSPTRNPEAIGFQKKLSQMSPDQSGAVWEEIAEKNPDLKKKLLTVEKDVAKGMTPRDFDLKAMGVGSGSRAKAIDKEFKRLRSVDARVDKFAEYVRKGVITDKVMQQLSVIGTIDLLDESPIDKTNTIPKNDQQEIKRAIEAAPRRQSGGRVIVNGREYTPEEIEGSRREDRRFREFLGRVAPHGIPWQSYRRSRNVEDRSNETEVSGIEQMRRRYPLDRMPDAPLTPMSRQAGYDDIGRRRGGKIARRAANGIQRVPPTATIPENPTTLKRQQQALISGSRKAMLFPHRGTELALPRGMKRIKTKDGLLHFNPKLLKPSQIKKASDKGKLNEVLDLGPVTKEEALARASLGEKPVAITERTPDGVEMKAALGTEQTAPEQVAALQETADPGDWVNVEEVPETLAKRLKDGGTAKVSKADAKYVNNSTKNGQRCKVCSMFCAPSTCTAVQGTINPRGWCRLFEKA